MVDCQGCGKCCMLFNLTDNEEIIKLNLSDEDGKCRYLENKRCSIYSERPDICNSETVYDKYYKNTLSKEQYRKLMKLECKNIEKLYFQIYGRMD